MPKAPQVCLAATLAVATGCGTDGSPAPDSGAPSDSAIRTDGNGDGDAATFTMVYNIFSANCGGAACHLRSSAGGLDMNNRETAYAELVGTPASGPSCDGQGTRVVPSDPEASLLIAKLTSPPCGGRMPLGGASLTEGQIDMVRSWIRAGAKDD